jgi:hypothetical protein
MKKEAEFEMRDEYDFSGGVRGRHAARFTAQEREDLFRRAAVEDVQTWTMSSLYEVQALEAAFFSLLVLAENRSPDEAATGAAALLTRGEAGTLGEELAGVLRQRLKFVATERNWLVHRGVFEAHTALSRADKAPALLERLQHLVTEARELRSHVESLVAQHLSAAGMSAEEAITRRDDTVGLWQAAA